MSGHRPADIVSFELHSRPSLPLEAETGRVQLARYEARDATDDGISPSGCALQGAGEYQPARVGARDFPPEGGPRLRTLQKRYVLFAHRLASTWYPMVNSSWNSSSSSRAKYGGAQTVRAM